MNCFKFKTQLQFSYKSIKKKIKKKNCNRIIGLIHVRTNCTSDTDRARSGAQNLLDSVNFSGAHILSCKKNKYQIYMFPVKQVKQEKGYSEFQILLRTPAYLINSVPYFP